LLAWLDAGTAFGNNKRSTKAEAPIEKANDVLFAHEVAEKCEGANEIFLANAAAKPSERGDNVVEGEVPENDDVNAQHLRKNEQEIIRSHVEVKAQTRAGTRVHRCSGPVWKDQRPEVNGSKQKQTGANTCQPDSCCCSA